MIRTLCLLPLPLMLAAPAYAQLDLDPGMWEHTSTITSAEMPSMPPDMASAMIGQETVTNACVTAEQLAQGPQALFDQTGGQCSYSTLTMSGGELSMSGSCSAPGGGGQMTMTATGTYTRTSYESQSTVSMGMPGGEMKIEATGSGRRTGDC